MTGRSATASSDRWRRTRPRWHVQGPRDRSAADRNARRPCNTRARRRGRRAPAGPDARGQQDCALVDHRIDRGLELHEEHRFPALTDLHERAASAVPAFGECRRSRRSTSRPRGRRRARPSPPRQRSPPPMASGGRGRFAASIRDQPGFRQPLRFGQARSEHRRQHDFICAGKGAREISWKTRRQDDAERGSKIAQMRCPGAAV